MAYYNKQEAKNFIDEKIKYCEENKFKLMIPAEEVLKKLENSDFTVGIFWIETTTPTITSFEQHNMKMEGKLFVKINSEKDDAEPFYCDDRYCIDVVQAQKENKTVIEIIKDREKQQKEAEQKFKYQNIDKEIMDLKNKNDENTKT